MAIWQAMAPQKRWITTAASAAVVSVVLVCEPTVSQAQAARVPSRHERTFRLVWDAAEKTWSLVPPSPPRITSDESVQVTVEGFNFLHYKLDVSSDATKVESYQYLEKLWESILSPTLAGVVGVGIASPHGLVPKGPTDVDAGYKAIAQQALFEYSQAVYRASSALDQHLRSVGGAAKGVSGNVPDQTHLTDEQREGIAEWLKGTLALRERLAEATKALEGLIAGDPTVISLVVEKLPTAEVDAFRAASVSKVDIERGVASQVFSLALGQYQSLVKQVTDGRNAAAEKAATLVALAEAAARGQFTTTIGRKASGTYVTLTCRAVTASGASQELASGGYLVESSRGLVFHTGLTGGSLNDFSFEKVQRVVDGQPNDVFLQTGSAARTADFVTFLGLQLGKPQDESSGGVAWMLSLGTGLKSPGARIYFGPSVSVKRFVITAGVVVGKEKKGEEQTLEPSVFRVLRESTEAKVFFGLSVRLY